MALNVCASLDCDFFNFRSHLFSDKFLLTMCTYEHSEITTGMKPNPPDPYPLITTMSYLQYYLWFVECHSMASHRESLKTLLVLASSKTITFYNKDTRGEVQRATFNEERVKQIFHGSFHKVNLMYDSVREEYWVYHVVILGFSVIRFNIQTIIILSYFSSWL